MIVITVTLDRQRDYVIAVGEERGLSVPTHLRTKSIYPYALCITEGNTIGYVSTLDRAVHYMGFLDFVNEVERHLF